MDVTDFNATDANTSTDIAVTGGSIINFDHFNGAIQLIVLISFLIGIRKNIPYYAGAAVDAPGYSQKKVGYFAAMIRLAQSSNLVGWWTFDEKNGTLVDDQSGGDAHARLFGTADLDLNVSKFGAGSLYLMVVQVGQKSDQLLNQLRPLDSNELIGWVKFDEGGGSVARNSVTGVDSSSLVSGAVFSTTEKTFGKSASSSSNKSRRVQEFHFLPLWILVVQVQWLPFHFHMVS